MEILVALVITVLALGFVGLPLLKEKKQEDELELDGAYENAESERLLSQKDTAVNAIRELEFDYAVGNLSDQDYQELREKYERRAISVLRTLDEVGEAGTNGRSVSRRRRRSTARREETRSEGPVCPACGEPYEEGDAFCALCGTQLDAAYETGAACPECGEPYEEGDAFCAACGAQLPALAEDGTTFDSGPESENSVEVQQRQRAQRRRRNRRVERQRRTGGNGKGAK